MRYLCPQSLTQEEQASLLEATRGHPRDHLIYSLALGTGLRLAEIVGLNVGDTFLPSVMPRTRIRLRADIVKGGRGADVFLPDSLVFKLKRFWAYKVHRNEPLEPSSDQRAL